MNFLELRRAKPLQERAASGALQSAREAVLLRQKDAGSELAQRVVSRVRDPNKVYSVGRNRDIDVSPGLYGIGSDVNVSIARNELTAELARNGLILVSPGRRGSFYDNALVTVRATSAVDPVIEAAIAAVVLRQKNAGTEYAKRVVSLATDQRKILSVEKRGVVAVHARMNGPGANLPYAREAFNAELARNNLKLVSPGRFEDFRGDRAVKVRPSTWNWF